ncbi:zinc finger CCHC domain-containing protein 14 isoform X1 [Labrus bergylta]|uniref:zinc finger CCHC domain-containing protein 14 isoform X1 n=1 Tax=Labrus bergylta TaxID=56723 RepID=UPI0009B42ADE|nr:LOW QUALITY PROTEIN: zinc finger CCHC domain-containing protein 14 [Labrus bergylta]
MVESRSCVQREGVYRWFSFLTSAQRTEFLCGLLDLCVPIELRFLGSCLEDLARKDYHSLRDAEIKANNPVDLSGLTNITEEVVRSKLLVSLALLCSDNRDAAGVLYRTLTHIDTVINNYGLALNDGRTEEQFLLLFTMASHHPAFSFHQKQVLRQQLSQIQEILQVSSEAARGAETPAAGPSNDKAATCYTQPHHHDHNKPASLPLASLPPTSCSLPDASASYLPKPASQTCHTHCPCWHTSQSREANTVAGLGSGVTVGRRDQVVSQELISPPSDLPPPPPPPPLPPPPPSPPHTSTPLPSGQGPDSVAQSKIHMGKAGKVGIESVVLRGETHTSEDISEYVFEVRWSDGFVSSIVRTQDELTELLSQLSQAFPDEGLEKCLPQSIELDPRCLTALPGHVLQHQRFQLFFTSTRPHSPNSPPSLPSPSGPPLPSSIPTAPVAPTYPFTSSSNLGCMVQHRGTNRAIYRVASVQPVISNHSSVLTRPSPHMSSLPPPLPSSIPPPQHSPKLSFFPPSVPALPIQGSMAGGGDPSSSQTHGQSHSYPQQNPQHHLPPQTSSQSCALPQSLYLPHSSSTSHSHSQSLSYPQSHSQSRSQSHTQVPSQSQPNSPEQNGILDWLRRLRLHKYYPVFKQLTMEEFLALTEEDLDKYDLTQGAKKKLKTQLELQKSADREMKIEKRSCNSIARVTPSSHMGHSTNPASTAELQVEVDAVPHHHFVSKDISSSSGYSSSPCSPQTPLCCDSTYDRSRDIHRRVSGPDTAGVGPEKDRSCLFVLNSSCPTGFSRPTAQVLPVQTDPAASLPPSCSFSLPQSPYHPQASYPQTLLSPVSNPARILTSPRKPRPPPLCAEERTKPMGSGYPSTSAGFSKGLSVGIGVRLENLFPGLKMDGSTKLQDSLVCCEMAGGAMGLMVETSSALTSTSNSLHHVSHPPLHFHLSSSSSPSLSGYYSSPPTSSASCSFSSFLSSSCPSTKTGSLSGTGNGGGFIPIAAASSVPIDAVPYYLPQPTSSPSSSSCSGSSLDQSSGHNLSLCVCSSCGCRGNCGAYGMLPGYTAAGYLQSFSACPSLFTLGPLFHFSPLVNSSSACGTGATSFSYPMKMPPPLYHNSPISHEQQQGFAFYHSQSVGNGSQKQPAVGLSCYNCGANGHRAEECKQPPMGSAQQGTYRLNYSPHSDSKDSGD